LGKTIGQNRPGPAQSFFSGKQTGDMITVPGKKAVVVGIVFRPKDIILVKTEKKSQGNHHLLDYHKHPLPDGAEISSPVYARILNEAITDFCSQDKQYETWCIIPSINVQTKYLAVPRVKDKQLYNAVYWSFKNEMPFDEEKYLFDFDIISHIVENGIQKIETLAYSAPLETLETVKQVFANAAIRLDGVSIVAFGIQNLLRTQFLQPGCESVCTLFIGTDWSRIDIFTQNHLYLSRDIKTGYQSFLHNIEDVISQKDLNQTQLRKLADDFFTHHLIHSKIIDCDQNEHFSKIESVTDRLVKQIARTFEYFVTNSGKKPIQKLYLTGRLCDFEGLIDYLSKKLGIPVEIIDSFSGSVFQDVPELKVKSVSDRYLPAFGISLSDTRHTPNFINTFKDRQAVRQSKMIDRIFAAGIILMMALLSGFIYFQKYQIQNKTMMAENIIIQIEKTGGTPITEEMIIKKNQDLRNYQKQLEKTADHFSGIAAISELCQLTSDNIALSDMVILNSTVDGKLNRSLTAKGYIFENKLLLDATLAGYRETLNSSSLFSNITVLQKTFMVVDEKDVIFFEIKMDINRQQDA